VFLALQISASATGAFSADHPCREIARPMKGILAQRALNVCSPRKIGFAAPYYCVSDGDALTKLMWTFFATFFCYNYSPVLQK
jgi:hypothetical protein